MNICHSLHVTPKPFARCFSSLLVVFFSMERLFQFSATMSCSTAMNRGSLFICVVRRVKANERDFRSGRELIDSKRKTPSRIFLSMTFARARRANLGFSRRRAWEVLQARSTSPPLPLGYSEARKAFFPLSRCRAEHDLVEKGSYHLCRMRIIIIVVVVLFVELRHGSFFGNEHCPRE